MKMKQMVLVLVLASSSIALAKIDPKVPDFGELVSGIGKAIAIAGDLKNLGPQFKAFPSKINAITACMNYKAKSFPGWAKGQFSDADKAQMAAKKITPAQLQQLSRVCLGQAPIQMAVKAASGTVTQTDVGKIDCSTSRKCTSALIGSMEDMITNIQKTVISQNGLLGIITYNLFNTFASGEEVAAVQAATDKAALMMEEQKELLKNIREGVENPKKQAAAL
jgi:hypothetical protein